MSSRRILLGTIAASAAGLVAVSLAWACVPAGGLSLSPVKGAAGSQVMASGSGFEAGERVEIRWESRTGPLLATTTGPSFRDVAITIPADASPGDHLISAAGVGEHADHGATAASFEVTATEQPPVQPPAPQPPAPTPPATPIAPRDDSAAQRRRATARRARAIKRCKRKYSAKKAKSAAGRRRMAKKRRACMRKAKRISATRGSSTSLSRALTLLG